MCPHIWSGSFEVANEGKIGFGNIDGSNEWAFPEIVPPAKVAATYEASIGWKFPKGRSDDV
jgi:hypothetical protein